MATPKEKANYKAYEAEQQRQREAENDRLRKVDTAQARAQIRNNETEIQMIKDLRAKGVYD